jgi:hypothetical protein
VTPADAMARAIAGFFPLYGTPQVLGTNPPIVPMSHEGNVAREEYSAGFWIVMICDVV